MINHYLIHLSTTRTSHWNQHTRAMAITTIRSALLRPNSKNHLRRDLTCPIMISSRETRPPLSRKIYHTRSESSFQLVSFNKFKLSNFVWEHSTLQDTPKDRVSFWDQLKHASGCITCRLGFSEVFGTLLQGDLGRSNFKPHPSYSSWPRDVKMSAITR